MSPRARRKNHTGLIVGLAVGSGLLLLLAVGVGWAIVRPRPAPPVMTREEFKAAVVGKTPDEVMARFGRPERTRDQGGGASSWAYHRKTLDPVSGKVDPITTIYFVGGRAVEVGH